MSVPKELSKKMYRIQKPTRWTSGIGLELPQAYKKFWREWKITAPEPVHFIPKEGKYEKRDDGTVVPVQNIPLPLKYPKEIDQGIWGGEAVVQGFYKSSKYTRRTVRYWVPQLKKSVIYSEILDKYMRTMVTDRAIDLIHKNYGFDHYILKTKACDLRSLLALHLKREMLINLADKTLYPNDLVKREEIYAKYEKYLEPYTREEIEWYGLSWAEACKKHIDARRAAIKIVPLKVTYRQEFIQHLMTEKQRMIEEGEDPSDGSWLSKINPFK
ncbi:39S ribosomal protein L28, mitochondrial [Copidosoma floridanum]|uniref:39S ribosomal protein L28, mitochondrial n=1 Tax=Copidosoma floridanum TaxID=29053 RepID=UPI0006C9A367|nr:39S ribosomal protein L28, mitochondrial [Copidosoma floridanum]